MIPRTLKTFSTLGPRDRLAMVYANLDELLENNRAHWIGAMHRKAKCLCVTAHGSRRHASLRSAAKALRGQGLRCEQVSFVDPRECLRRGKLSVPLLLERMEQECSLAAGHGFLACDISCDMASLHPILSRLEPFLQSLANGFQDKQPSALLLQLPQDGLPPAVFKALLRFSPLVLLNGRIRSNIRRRPWAASPATSRKQAREALHGIEQWNRVLDQNAALFSLFDQHGPAFCIIDDRNDMIHWNPAFAALAGLGRNTDSAPVPLLSVIRPHDLLHDKPAHPDAQQRSVPGEIKAPGRVTLPVTLSVHSIPDTREPDSWVRLIAVREIRPDPSEQDIQNRAEQQYQRIFELSRRGLAKIAADGSILHANKAFVDILGYQSQEALHGQGMHWWKANCVVAEQCLTLFQEIREKGSISRFELEVLAANRRPRLLLLDAYAAGSWGERDFSFIAVVEDITEQRKSERQLLRQAFHDQLTGLPNKALLMDRIEMALQQVKRKENILFALAFLDIDNFKNVNDTFGHVLGDQLLVQVAQRILKSVRNVDTVSRFGGDEFVVLLDGIVDDGEAMRILNRVREDLAVPLPVTEEQELVCTVSTGLVLSTGYASATEMLRDADMAMYKAKTENKGKIHLLMKPSRGHFPQGQHILRQDFSGAMDQGEFRLHYQPIFQISGKMITGFEALLRWQHPRLGLLHPADFLSLAEKSGHIIPLAQWVLGNACAQMRTWQLEYVCDPPLTVCVNLSAEQFAFPGIVESVQSVLEATGLDEHSLKLEFSRKAMAQSRNVGELLLRLKELDVQLTIDDFGMGYSTLLHLQRYPFVPIDNLKIDRAVISRLTDHNDYLEMVWTTIMLAHSLGVEVVAEGVETREQLKLLAEMNCDYAQGYLFSKPLEGRLAGELLKSHLHKQSFFSCLSAPPCCPAIART